MPSLAVHRPSPRRLIAWAGSAWREGADCAVDPYFGALLAPLSDQCFNKALAIVWSCMLEVPS